MEAEPAFVDTTQSGVSASRGRARGGGGDVRGAKDSLSSNARPRLFDRPPHTAAAPSAPGPWQITISERAIFTCFTGWHVHGASQAITLGSDLLSALFSAK